MYGHDAEQMGGFGGQGGAGFTNAEDLFRQMFGGGMGGMGGGMGDIFGGKSFSVYPVFHICSRFHPLVAYVTLADGRGSGRSPRRGNDLEVTLAVDFMEAVQGTTRELNISSQSQCETCKGSGTKPGTTPKRCTKCGGAGMFTQTQGWFQMQSACPACRGAGEQIEECRPCRGIGVQPNRRPVSVKIPAGVDTNTRLRLVGQGDAGAFAVKATRSLDARLMPA